MNLKSIFRMPTQVKITARSSTITNSFVNSIIPVIPPKESEIKSALEILNLDPEDLRCIYCGNQSSEWDHLRPLVKDRRPTGFISEISNLVPACGKCNQSKGNKEWREWINSDAKWSPKTRNIPGLDNKISYLEAYEKWGNLKPIKLETLAEKELWEKHWQNLECFDQLMKESQEVANQLNNTIRNKYKR